MLRAAAAAAAILILNGTLHGIWSFRWNTWSDSAVQAEHIKDVPLQIGDENAWEGTRIETDALTLPEELVGRGEAYRFVNRFSKAEVLVFLSCGPTDGLVAHTPRVCYPAHGYSCPKSDQRVSLPVGNGKPAAFWASTFSKSKAATAEHLRVLWAWSDGSTWQIPDNPLRTFRRIPVLYKCYVLRALAAPDESLEGDPGVEFLSALLPRLDGALAGAPR